MEKQGIEKVLEEFDKKFPKAFVKKEITDMVNKLFKTNAEFVPETATQVIIAENAENKRNQIKSFLRSAIETALREVRPETDKEIGWVSGRQGYDIALSDYDKAVKNYLGK